MNNFKHFLYFHQKATIIVFTVYLILLYVIVYLWIQNSNNDSGNFNYKREEPIQHIKKKPEGMLESEYRDLLEMNDRLR